MRTHQQIDRRSLVLARAVAERIDRDPSHAGLDTARQVCRRWKQQGVSGAIDEWLAILAGSWEQVRAVLLADDEEGRRLRQSTPFCGILTPRERWEIYERFANDEAARA